MKRDAMVASVIRAKAGMQLLSFRAVSSHWIFACARITDLTRFKNEISL